MGKKGLPITQPALLKSNRPPTCAHTPSEVSVPKCHTQMDKANRGQPAQGNVPLCCSSCVLLVTITKGTSARTIHHVALGLPGGSLCLMLLPTHGVFFTHCLEGIFLFLCPERFGGQYRSGGSRMGHLQALGLGHLMLEVQKMCPAGQQQPPVM